MALPDSSVNLGCEALGGGRGRWGGAGRRQEGACVGTCRWAKHKGMVKCAAEGPFPEASKLQETLSQDKDSLVRSQTEDGDWVLFVCPFVCSEKQK